MKSERLLRADGIIYGIVKSYKETKHNYIFIVNSKKLIFQKAKYNLLKTNRFYDMNL